MAVLFCSPQGGTRKARESKVRYGDDRPHQLTQVSRASTGQPTHPELLDARPLEHVNKIEIDEEHITIEFDEKTTRYYNINEITHREWVYKYNDDPVFVAAVGKRHRARAQASQGHARERRLPARLRGMLQRLRAVRQQGRRAAHRRSLRHELRRGDARIRRRAPVGRRLSRGLAAQGRRRHRRPVRLPHGLAQRTALLRHLRRRVRTIAASSRRSAATTSTTRCRARRRGRSAPPFQPKRRSGRRNGKRL